MPDIIVIQAATAEEASAIYRAARDASGEGASTFPCGEWEGHHISYNGRVWQNLAPGMTAKAIYNPGATCRLWVASTTPEFMRAELDAMAQDLFATRPDLAPMSLDEWIIEHDALLSSDELVAARALLDLYVERGLL